MGEGSDYLSLGRIGSVKSKTRSRSSDNLLFFRTSELAQNSLRDGSRGLQRQRVHKHGRSCRHLDVKRRDWRRSCRTCQSGSEGGVEEGMRGESRRCSLSKVMIVLLDSSRQNVL